MLVVQQRQLLITLSLNMITNTLLATNSMELSHSQEAAS